MVVWFQIYFQPGKKEKEREGNQKIVLFVVITIISTVQNWVHSQVAEVAVEERHSFVACAAHRVRPCVQLSISQFVYFCMTCPSVSLPTSVSMLASSGHQ